MKQTPEDARVEYAATNASYMHYDGFRWQAGSFLVAGVFIFWGLALQDKVPAGAFGAGSILVVVLMSIWLFFAHHYRQIYMWKLHRLWELEYTINAQQHLRFRPDPSYRSYPPSGRLLRLVRKLFGLSARGPAQYPVYGPRGHHLDYATYVVTSLGAVLLGIAKGGFQWTFVVPTVFTVVTLLRVRSNEKRADLARKSALRTFHEVDSHLS